VVVYVTEVGTKTVVANDLVVGTKRVYVLDTPVVPPLTVVVHTGLGTVTRRNSDVSVDRL
jgi:hypothetical protein